MCTHSLVRAESLFVFQSTGYLSYTRSPHRALRVPVRPEPTLVAGQKAIKLKLQRAVSSSNAWRSGFRKAKVLV